MQKAKKQSYVFDIKAMSSKFLGECKKYNKNYKLICFVLCGPNFDAERQFFWQKYFLFCYVYVIMYICIEIYNGRKYGRRKFGPKRNGK